jgi:hypothetical protein
MSEEMQPIDPVTAALLMGQVPDPCEPTIEISHKVLTRLMDVVEFGDQLERVEKDRLLAHLKEVLAAEQPVLWAMHSPGPGEVHPVISKEEAERQQSELLALCKKQFPEISITVNVIPSPFSPLEHFEILAGELSEQVKHLQDYVKGLEGAAKALATDATLDKFRASGLSIDGDNAYKRDLLDAVVGAMMLGRHNTTPPPAEHWAQRFWDIGREYAELPGAIVLPMPVMPEQPEDAIDDSWMDGYNAALRMREECQRAIDAAGTASSIAMPAGLHPDTQDLVTRFATALAVKLHAVELKHGYSNGWKDPNWMDECRQKLIEHLAKGDPRDVAAYCAFLWHHCQSTSPIPSTQSWIYASEGMPEAPLFDSLEVIVAVQRAHNGKVYVFTTDYLNRYPIIRMDQTVQDDDNASDEITGWYYLSDDEETWHRTLADGDRVIAWQLKPAAPEIPEQVKP